MGWRRFFEAIGDIIDRILGDREPQSPPPPVPDEPDEPDEPDVPDEPDTPEVPTGKGKKYVYDLKMDIEEADGLVAFPFEGGKVEGRLFVVGKEDDFSEPNGQTLLVSGVIEKVTAADGDDITGRMGDNTVMNPVPYQFSSYRLGYAVDNDKVSAAGNGVMADDFSRISDIVISGGGNGSYGSLVKKVVLKGNAVLKEVLDVDLETEKPEPNPDEGWKDSEQVFELSGDSEGEVSIETKGIEHRSGTNHDGGYEYIFLTLRGEDFDRFLLFNTGGDRGIRTFNEPPGKLYFEIVDNNLPDAHTWKVKWGGGVIRVYLDGQELEKATAEFHGRPTKAIAGGYENASRNFWGQWRNFIK